jgi:hypothetical protein
MFVDKPFSTKKFIERPELKEAQISEHDLYIVNFDLFSR